MALPHAQPGELIVVRPYGDDLPGQKTTTLFRSSVLQGIRLVVLAGHEIGTHAAHGELTIQCLEGRVAFTTLGRTLELTPGTMLYLPAGEPHSVKALDDSSLLLTLAARGSV